jgi:hypothetical protein
MSIKENDKRELLKSLIGKTIKGIIFEHKECDGEQNFITFQFTDGTGLRMVSIDSDSYWSEIGLSLV